MRRVYPRACGGTRLKAGLSILLRGLSPRLRGNGFQETPNLNFQGSIPALAGERLALNNMNYGAIFKNLPDFPTIISEIWGLYTVYELSLFLTSNMASCETISLDGSPRTLRPNPPFA